MALLLHHSPAPLPTEVLTVILARTEPTALVKAAVAAKLDRQQLAVLLLQWKDEGPTAPRGSHEQPDAA